MHNRILTVNYWLNQFLKPVRTLMAANCSTNISSINCELEPSCSVQSVDKDCQTLTGPPNKKLKTKLNDDVLKGENPEYYFETGFRKVRPYYFTYSTHSKGRWIGRRLVEVFNKEFHPRSPDFFEKAIEHGRLTVNGSTVTLDYVLKDLDFIRNTTHRHESPVLDRRIEVVAETEDYVVVNKPCSVPVHPCGKYHHNSVTSILRREHAYVNLRVGHRLDRATSGVLILSRNLRADQQLKKWIAACELRKEYVCMVEGHFPAGVVVCDKALECMVPSMGINKVSDRGKTSVTTFLRIFTDSNSSVVRCFPKTGRSHQIRVHLQYLGFPIVDDAIYNSLAFGPEKGRRGMYGKPVDELVKDVAAEHSYKSNIVEDNFNCDRRVEPEDSRYFDPHCPDCRIITKPLHPDQMQMHLHCLKYQFPDGSLYETPLPDWAINKVDAKQ